jgi:hypothetical protein
LGHEADQGISTVEDGPCPFCDGHYWAGEDPSEIIHSAPQCQKFLDVAPEEYLVMANDPDEEAYP